MLGPEALIPVEPATRLLHRFRPQPARDGAPGLRSRDQPGVGQDVQVLHHGGQRHRERPRELADRHALLLLQACKEGPPRRVGERGKGPVERVGTKVNHLVKCLGVLLPAVNGSRAKVADPVIHRSLTIRIR